MRLDKDERKEIKHDYAIWDAYGVRAGIRIAVAIVILVLAWSGYRQWKVHRDYEIWQDSQMRIEGAIEELAKYRLEMARASTDVEKAAIAQYVVDRLGSFDPHDIEDSELREFFYDCLDGTYIITEEDK